MAIDFQSFMMGVASGSTVVEGGATILSGNAEPTATTGENGDIYLKYAPIEILDYLQSNGNSSIDTGVDIENNSYFELKAAYIQNTDNNNIYGFGYSNKECNVIVYQGKIYNNIAGGNSNISYNTNDHIFKSDASNVYIDETTGTPNWNNVPTGNRIRLFATAYNGSFNSSRISYAKLYYCKMYKGDTLVRDFIPARINNELGMYDKVNAKFYTNSGSAAFTFGSVVSDGTNLIQSAYYKKNGVWISLIGADIDNIID